MDVDISQFTQIFFDETEELLSEAERLLLNIDIAHPDPDDINAIFRAAHSIKGGSATFGMTDMTDVTHVMESLLDNIRNGDMALTAEHVEVFLVAKDVLKMLRDGHQYGTEVDNDAVSDLMASLNKLSHASSAGAAVEGAAAPLSATALPNAVKNYEIDLSATLTGESLDALVDELGELGTLHREARPDGTTHLTLRGECSHDDIMSLCAFVLGPDELTITETGSPQAETDTRTDEERGYGFFDNFEPPAQNADALKASQAVAKKKAEPAAAKRPAAVATSASIRVGVDKVDQLINLVGELVITQAMLEQQAGALDPMQHQRLLDSMSQLSRNTRDLQQAVMSMRMMPMDYVFSRFPRMVHDLSSKLGKKVELLTSGAATELDKGLIERIIDPLTHLVRNSVDHGIELPHERVAQGKDEAGKIFLSAAHQGGNIVVEVNDDGAGLNREKILTKAAERGLPVSENMSDSDVWNLIFAPGFSTADAVTDVSGRGVGMDVVKRNITEMGGFVDIRSSKGVGTMMSVYLPLTLAILDGMSIRTGEEIYILPLAHVVESLQPLPEDVRELQGQGKIIKVREDYLPLLAMGEIFDITPRSATPSEGIVVILEADGSRAAMWIDELVGQQQVVVKNLESNYRKVP
ncbi:MAG: Hpt domain-containing protein, partial [Burkholderiaceae bacterium]|nr:Hpt domain-containing protein [Burkholderiaceae bacterium]